MKAATFASILAVSFAGVACSEKAADETETADAASETSQPKASEFNLRYPTTGPQQSSSAGAGEFNLRVPDSNAAGSDSGVRLPDGAVREDPLSGIDEIRTPDMATPEAEAPAEEAPEDEIIRLD